jgi:hypothetical protein
MSSYVMTCHDMSSYIKILNSHRGSENHIFHFRSKKTTLAGSYVPHRKKAFSPQSSENASSTFLRRLQANILTIRNNRESIKIEFTKLVIITTSAICYTLPRYKTTQPIQNYTTDTKLHNQQTKNVSKLHNI